MGLGHIFDESSMRPDTEKVAGIGRFPTTSKQIRTQAGP